MQVVERKKQREDRRPKILLSVGSEEWGRLAACFFYQVSLCECPRVTTAQLASLSEK